MSAITVIDDQNDECFRTEERDLSPTQAEDQIAPTEDAFYDGTSCSSNGSGPPDTLIANSTQLNCDEATVESMKSCEIIDSVGGAASDNVIKNDYKERVERRKLEKEAMKRQREAENEELRARRFKQFQHLLNRSKFFTQFLVKKMEEQKFDTEKENEKSKKHQRSIKKEDVEESDNTVRKTRSSTNVTVKPVKTTNRRSRSSRRNGTEKEVKIADYVKPEDLNTSRTINEEPTDNSAEDTFSRRINGEPVSDHQPNWFTGGVMRSYQIAGFQWLRVLYENGLNGILADEMGLGKTIQCIALIAHLMEREIAGPYIVIAPLSTLTNWVREFAFFTPRIPTVLYHGKQEHRTVLRNAMTRKVKVEGGSCVLPVVITSYDVVMRDRKHLQNWTWKYIIIDEGHRIKNMNCQLVRELKYMRSVNKLLLTGTPLQNNLSELWSLLNFLLPDIFNKLEIFESWFDAESLEKDDGDERIVVQEQEKHILSTMHEILSPFLLRRLKSDVALYIPPKKELLVFAPLTPKQQEFYKATVDKTILNILEPNKEFNFEQHVSQLPKKRRRKSVMSKELLYDYLEGPEDRFDFVEESDSDDNSPTAKKAKMQWLDDQTTQKSVDPEKKKNFNYIRLQNVVMQLRKCCNHPYLLSHPLDDDGEYIVDESLVETSGKLLVLDAMLPRLKKGGHKVLVFSQMTKLMDILQDYCDMRSFSYSILDGRMKLEDREEEIQKFNKDPETFIFLLSTRAGGLGLNLVAADTVIIYDSDWNPQCDLQAMDRCHRIGQTKPVVVYRLVTSNSVDQRIIERAASKRKLEKMVMHKDKFKSGVNTKKEFSKEELLELLRSKDFERVVQTGGVNCIFSEDEMTALLDRSDMLNGSTSAPSSDKSKNHIFKVIDEDDDQPQLRLVT